MISFEIYKMLSEIRQIDVLLEFGVYTELNRKEPGFYIELYILDDFYVEIYFDEVTEDPLFLRYFQTAHEVEPYLSSIEIDSLFQTK